MAVDVPPERIRTLLILAAVAIVGVVSFRLGLLGAESRGPGSISLSGSTAGWPDRPEDARDEPLAQPPAAGNGIGQFAFIATQKGGSSPVAYDPCVPIHLVVNPRTEVPEGERLVEEAIDRVEDASGLRFVVDGTTSEIPNKKRAAQADRYGDGWSPVLVAWSDEDEMPDLEGDTAGIGGSSGALRDDHTWFVSGSLSLDGPQLADIVETTGGWDAARAVVMHELGHVVGLNHVDAAGELMQPKGSADRTEWGPGDLEGLAALGSGRCVEY